MAYNTHFVYAVNQKQTNSRRLLQDALNLQALLGDVLENAAQLA